MGQLRRGMLVLGVAAVTAATAGCGGDDGDDAGAPAKAQAPATTATAPAEPAAPATTTTTPSAADDDAVPAAKLTPVSGNPVGRAAAVAQRQKGGLAVSMRGTIDASGSRTTISGTGRIDRTTHRGTFSSTTGIKGVKVKVRTVMDGHAVYLSSDAFAGRLPGQKSWMKIDLAKAARQQGFDLSSLGTNGPSQDPAQVLDYLAGAGKAKKVGTAKVRGVATTRYRVTADLKKARSATASKTSKIAIDQLLGTLSGETKVPVDVWVDKRHRVLREEVRYTSLIQGVENKMRFTTDFTGFGVPVKVDKPPSGDTVDGLALLAKAQAAQQQSG